MQQAGTKTFSEVAGARGTTKLNRPNCLNFKSTTKIKRIEALKMMSDIGFSKSKITGVAEMKGHSIDVTCNTRKDVLELFKELKKVNTVFNIHLYQSQFVTVVLGWVPIPMTNNLIKKEIEKQYGEVLDIQCKKYKDGLLSGIRLVSMQKSTLDQNPIPSYIKINSFEIYVTYPGQQSTCRYCSETGHEQSSCPKKLNDFPSLPTIQNDNPTNKIKSVGQNKKQNLQDQAEEYTCLPGNTEKENTASTVVQQEKVNKYHSLTKEQQDDKINATDSLTAEHVREKEKKKETKRKKHEKTVCDLNNAQQMNSCEWFEESTKLICTNCNTENQVSLNASSFSCNSCLEEFDVISPCCAESNAWERFIQTKNNQKCKCSKCDSDMFKLPCCNRYQLIYQTAKGDLITCKFCSNLNILCDCCTINKVPPVAQSRYCAKGTCQYKIIHCNCGICDKFLFKGSQKYLCDCGYEYEPDIDIGVLVS